MARMPFGELEVQKTGDPSPLEVYLATAHPRHPGHLSGLLKQGCNTPPNLTPSPVFPHTSQKLQQTGNLKITLTPRCSRCLFPV